MLTRENSFILVCVNTIVLVILLASI